MNALKRLERIAEAMEIRIARDELGEDAEFVKRYDRLIGEIRGIKLRCNVLAYQDYGDIEVLDSGL